MRKGTQTQYVLWGFKAGHGPWLKLKIGSIRECRRAWKYRIQEGWAVMLKERFEPAPVVSIHGGA